MKLNHLVEAINKQKLRFEQQIRNVTEPKKGRRKEKEKASAKIGTRKVGRGESGVCDLAVGHLFVFLLSL